MLAYLLSGFLESCARGHGLRRIYRLIGLLMTPPLRRLDRLLARSPSAWDSAGGTFFFGQRREHPSRILKSSENTAVATKLPRTSGPDTVIPPAQSNDPSTSGAPAWPGLAHAPARGAGAQWPPVSRSGLAARFASTRLSGSELALPAIDSSSIMDEADASWTDLHRCRRHLIHM